MCHHGSNTSAVSWPESLDSFKALWTSNHFKNQMQFWIGCELQRESQVETFKFEASLSQSCCFYVSASGQKLNWISSVASFDDEPLWHSLNTRKTALRLPNRISTGQFISDAHACPRYPQPSKLHLDRMQVLQWMNFWES